MSTVLLLHAGIADSRMWQPQVEVLEEAGYGVIAPDLRGFGERRLEPARFSHLRDTEAVLDGPVSVVGSSLGGRVALELALHRPDLVERLVLIAPGLPGWDWSAETRAGWAEEEGAFGAGEFETAAEAAGVLFAEPDGREMLLVASGLPPLPGDQRYQVWLFTTDDELVSAGLVNAGNSGEVRVVLRTPEPFANYVGVGLTAEPQGGSAAPTSGMVLGGSLPPMDPIPPESA